MKSPGLFVVLTALAWPSINVVAQQPKAASAPTADERAVLDLEEAWAKAVVKRDATTFKRLLAPGFTYTEDDRMQNGAELTRDIVSGTDTVTEARNEKLATQSYGNTMIVTGCNTSGCIRGSALDSFSHRFRTLVPEDCVGDIEEQPHRDNLRDIGRRYVDVVDLAFCTGYLESWARRNST